MNAQPPHRTLRSWVYETLRERIIAGDLAPGETLVEAQLAKEFGLSRSPVREAFRQLGQDGLVITMPNAATTATSMDEFDIDQIFEMRDLLESSLIAHAAVDRTESELEDCELLLAQMPVYAAKADIRKYAEIDAQFHRQLWTMAKRPRVTATLMPIADQARRYMNLSSRQLQSESSDTLEASYEEHVRIFKAIQVGHVREAVGAARVHMSSSRKRILQSFWEAKEVDATEKVPSANRSLGYTITWTGGDH